jgi:hypothetical protein
MNNISVDKAGDLKLGRKKCRLYKRDEVVKVAKKYGIRGTEKLSVRELCDGIMMRASLHTNNYETLREAKKKATAKKKRAASKKVTPSRKAAIDKKIVTSFMKNMVTTNANIKKLQELNVKPNPRSPSPAAVQRARRNAKAAIQNRVSYEKNKAMAAVNQASPHAVMRIARELRRLR